jgi:tetratricopeptide (TPR) repeat protein
LDLSALWDFRDPSGSERRFWTASQTASGDDALLLRTQIARTYGLRRDFDHVRELLEGVERNLPGAGREVHARYWLELGRSYSSATHDETSQTDAVRGAARACFRRALDEARAGGLDALAIDAVHMMAFVDVAPEDGVRWADAGLEIALASGQPAARRWQASLRNNRGVALGRLGRHQESLAEYEQMLALTQGSGDPTGFRIAEWMVASALRQLGRLDEAAAIQLRLEQEWDDAGEPDPYVFEELEAIYAAQRNSERAAHYAARKAAHYAARTAAATS